ncbi:MAG TPA: outer membrane beta-barrel protein [Chitinophagaceae bacterium]|nr:outer membrane beta-barrel protein [Chitinophagaceae bacterium]
MKFFSRYCVFILFAFASLATFSQEIKVTLKAINNKNEAIVSASFKINRRDDSLQVIEKISDSNGVITINLLQNKQYIVQVTAVNYTPIEKIININVTRTFFAFSLKETSKTLENVTVTSSRPLLRQEDDKIIVDPENIAATSTSAYEIIEKTPGLFTDQDGNIYLNNTTPASIYVNGREIKMSAADLASMLKSLPPTAIEKIEILRTPSAKYDASGSGGVINIILKKGIKIGITGSITGGFAQGVYGNQFAGVNFNSNKDERNFYVNLNFSRRNTYEEINTNRKFSPDSLLGQDAYTTFPTNVYFAGYGWSKDVSKKWSITFDGRISLNDFKNKSRNESIINKISSSQNVRDVVSDVTNDGSSFIANQAFNAKYKIDTLGSEWTFDISYTYSKNISDQLFVNTFLLPAGNSITGNGDIDNSRYVIVAQTDLKKKLLKKITIEGGIKSSYLKFNSITDYSTNVNGANYKDLIRTNTFHYKENINAAYLQASKGLGKALLKTGIRLENTQMNGRQIIPGDTSFKINRTDFFPYVYLSKPLITIAGYSLRGYLIYRRSINRPVYEQLNPFPKFIDQFLNEVGNPSLRPQFTNNYEANVSFDERPILAFGHNYTKDIFTNVIYQSDSSRSIAYRTYDNLGTNKEIYFRALGALPQGKKYFFVAGVLYNHYYYKGLYENKPLSFKRGSWSFFTYHQLKLDKLSQVTLHGFVRFNGTQQFYELGTFGSLNASVNRQFINKKLTVTISVSDIFFTNNNTFKLLQGTVNANGNRQADTRRVGLNLRYNFGIRKKEEKENLFNIESPENKN